jgi:hypothetical protein
MKVNGLGRAKTYKHLEQFDVTPASSMDEIKEANFKIMEADHVTAEVKRSGEQLSRLNSRLEIDFFLFQAIDHAE